MCVLLEVRLRCSIVVRVVVVHDLVTLPVVPLGAADAHAGVALVDGELAAVTAGRGLVVVGRVEAHHSRVRGLHVEALELSTVRLPE